MHRRATLPVCCAAAERDVASAPASEDSRKRRRSIRGVVSQILDIDAVAESPDPRAMLLAELEDFVIRHRPCGQPTGDATEPEPDGYIADSELLLRRQLPAVGDAGGGDAGAGDVRPAHNWVESRVRASLASRVTRRRRTLGARRQ